jgi:hypothetical protein
MNQYELVPFRKSLLHLTEKQVQYNKTYLDMLDTFLTTPSFYYSHTYDLSHNLQALDFNSPDFYRKTIFERAEPNFTWNTGLLGVLQGRPELHKYCVALIHGFVSISVLRVNSKEFKLVLISRRSTKRSGTRLFTRGIDADGNVANFVEAEQILECDGDIASFIQIRGSIPLFWTQKPNLRYKPAPQLAPVNHTDAFVKHFEDLVVRYNRVVCINLVNQTGSESVLEDSFRKYVETSGVQNVRYEAFDFHHECRNMKWDRLDILINRLSTEVDDFGYFFQSNGQRQQQQDGVFRTNCIDCLDRTNVVQGMLAKINLEQVLQKFRVLREGEKISRHPEMEYLFKNIWADNGDICSIEYSGTGALKTDFTRTGKRTFVGVMNDGWNSIVRYIKNNFSDGSRQDGMDLFLGNYVVQNTEGRSTPSPLEKNRDWKFYALPTLLIISIAMWFYLAFSSSPYTSEDLLYMLFWGSMFFATGGVMFHYGTEFVDNPSLTDVHRLTM